MKIDSYNTHITASVISSWTKRSLHLLTSSSLFDPSSRNRHWYYSIVRKTLTVMFNGGSNSYNGPQVSARSGDGQTFFKWLLIDVRFSYTLLHYCLQLKKIPFVHSWIFFERAIMISIVIVMNMVEMETLTAAVSTIVNPHLAVNCKDQTRDQRLLGSNKVAKR